MGTGGLPTWGISPRSPLPRSASPDTWTRCVKPALRSTTILCGTTCTRPTPPPLPSLSWSLGPTRCQRCSVSRTWSLSALSARFAGLHCSTTALVGFDDFPLADLLEPGVTVVAQDPTAIGKLAAEIVFRRIDGDVSPVQEHVVPTHLIKRASGTIPPSDVLAS